MDSPYGCHFDRQGLSSELSYIFSSVSFKVESVSNLHSYIVTNDFSETLPEVSKLIKLILTIPATSASAERSFSALKRIKNYCRNTTAQDRLNGLASISIEKSFFSELKKHYKFHDTVIDIFAAKKERRIELHYK